MARFLRFQDIARNPKMKLRKKKCHKMSNISNPNSVLKCHLHSKYMAIL